MRDARIPCIVRQSKFRERARHLHHPVPRQRAILEQCLHHLLYEERIPAGALGD